VKTTCYCELVESAHIALAVDAAAFSKAEINIGVIATFVPPADNATERIFEHPRFRPDRPPGDLCTSERCGVRFRDRWLQVQIEAPETRCRGTHWSRGVGDLTDGRLI
jgi:hypothetical protein